MQTQSIHYRVGSVTRHPDRVDFTDDAAADAYDRLYPWERRRDFRFHLSLCAPGDAVLDIGCGTGTLLGRLRDDGHAGRLVGLDPGAGMLARARRRTDVEWVLGTLATTAFDAEFDLVVMTGHAFQELTTDDALRTTLAGVASALRPGGRFSFEVRNPLRRAWEAWTPGNAETLPDGTRLAHEVLAVTGDVVTFTSTLTGPGREPSVSTGSLRFPSVADLDARLAAAGLTVTERYGDFDRSPLTPDSPEIVTITRRTS